MRINKIAKQSQTFKFSSCTKALYTVVLLLIQRIEKPLTRRGAKGISITFRVSQFQETACDIHLHLAREVKINLKQRFRMIVKMEKFHPRWDSNPQPLN